MQRVGGSGWRRGSCTAAWASPYSVRRCVARTRLLLVTLERRSSPPYRSLASTNGKHCRLAFLFEFDGQTLKCCHECRAGSKAPCSHRQNLCKSCVSLSSCRIGVVTACRSMCNCLCEPRTCVHVRMDVIGSLRSIRMHGVHAGAHIRCGGHVRSARDSRPVATADTTTISTWEWASGPARCRDRPHPDHHSAASGCAGPVVAAGRLSRMHG